MTKPAKALRPFFSYYGGKWRDAVRLYPRPEHATIIEPFAGSAGYSLRYPDKAVILYEIDPVIIAVWRFLIAAKVSEILAIPDMPLDGTCDDLKVCQEAKWLVGFWLNRGTSSPRKSPSKWMRDRIRPGSFWGSGSATRSHPRSTASAIGRSTTAATWSAPTTLGRPGSSTLPTVKPAGTIALAQRSSTIPRWPHGAGRDPAR